MVRLEHVNLVVKDIPPTLTFLLTAFPEWRIRGEGKMTWGSGEHASSRHWLHIGDDDYYLTLNGGAVGEIRDAKGIEPGVAHIGFVVDDLQAVIDRLSAKGFSLDIKGRLHPFRQTVYYMDPAGLQFEFLQYASDKPDEKNMYGGESGELQKRS
ncbi:MULTISPECIES: VOC family protein [unclassified Shewanella]|uniref:VOC family protein n=1 Tax=unclassified Shewanella TaxID=196818 RepID=UPI001BC615B5|nr:MULTISPECIES: VOC family protein [unclassified Shewanella]GIU20803.1 glyoxalase [Shewanella sp. MBTL60-112-B1]GIU30020.1 glyoxalase [Shewanella sp. MBTL60-112-B2]